MPPNSYPATPAERDAWVLSRRGERNAVDPWRPHGFFVENERDASGQIVPVATVLLSNRECPWRCLMCDLWKNTLDETAPVGAIPAQIDFALGQLPRSRQIKLYNSGSFFDAAAIPPADYPAIAERAVAFDNVIVESHPALISGRVLSFRDRVQGKLEVAVGLETANPIVLDLLNKRITLESFKRAADFLRHHQISLRVFVLLKPPFLAEDQAVEWARRSIDFAFDCGATVVSVIPTRFGNGALEALAGPGDFSPPKLRSVEAVLDYGIHLRRGRVFADLWDLAKFSECDECFPARLERLRRMNDLQTRQSAVVCSRCGGTG